MDQESIKITRTGIGRWEVTYEPVHGWHDADQEADFQARLEAWIAAAPRMLALLERVQSFLASRINTPTSSEIFHEASAILKDVEG